MRDIVILTSIKIREVEATDICVKSADDLSRRCAVFLLNSAVLTSFGAYAYRPLALEQFKQLLPQATSYVGYPATADAIRILTGVSVNLNRGLIKMAVGDKAIVFRLAYRVADPTRKGTITAQQVLADYEIGLMEKTR
jgi:hypothetical protein